MNRLDEIGIDSFCDEHNPAGLYRRFACSGFKCGVCGRAATWVLVKCA